MNCPVCGGNLSDQVSICPTCGSPVTVRASGEGANENMASPQQGYDTPQQQYGTPQQQYGTPQQGYGMPQQQYGTPQQGYGMLQQQYGTPQQYGTSPQQGYDMQQQYGTPQQYGTSPQQGYGLPPQPSGGGRKKSHVGLIVALSLSALVITAAVLLLFVFDVFGIFEKKDGTYRAEIASDGVVIQLVIDGEKGTISSQRDGADDESMACTVSFEDTSVRLVCEAATLSGTYNKDDKSISFSRRSVEETGLLQDRSMDGTYYLDVAMAYGIKIESDKLSDYGLDPKLCKVIVSGETATVDIQGNTTECRVKFTDGAVSFENGNSTLEGTYDEEKGEISLTSSSIEIVFKKENAGSASSETDSVVLRKIEK